MFRWTTLIAVVALALVVSSPALAGMDSANQGNYMIGGTVSITSVDNDNFTDRLNTWTLAPTAMYFVADNFGIGTQLNFVGTTSGNFGSSVHRHFAMGQWVFPINNENFRPFAQFGGGFSRSTVQDPAGDIVFNGWGMTAGIGAYMFLNEHVAIMPQVSYVYETFSDDGLITRGEDQTIFFGIGVAGFVLP